ncbi:UDP-N-acetylmuramoyl-tripeptide--D-alanyl-D-alanine ligase [Dokdonella sp.]|uniref:UDP-N-acetylmuramoyl-tripeptide--D-alanyl-D- alanine ligase n=1 Tax=Dokdonella sp. TaxID=2291710 RepID=UPI003C3C8576
MMTIDLAMVADSTHGCLKGASIHVSSVSTDSRNMQAGALFVALRGEHHDAHAFVGSALANGAVAALVDHEVDVPLPQVVVADTELALGQLAGAVRALHEVCVIGITGSNGKTTVKSLVASILSRHAPTHVNSGSFNNEIGLPLTLLSMPEGSRFAVLEMGAGKPGDIDYLVRIARPQIGLVNNIAPAHLERMGSIDGIAETKGALYTGLPVDGVAIINADDVYAEYFTGLAAGRRIFRFGLGDGADVTARDIRHSAIVEFTLVTAQGELPVSLALSGRHNLLNALAAASVALAVDVPLETIKAGLEAARPVAGRVAGRSHPSGAKIIDDSYNANPASFAAAIDALAACAGRRILVMGDMRELGADGLRLHADTGALALQRGIESLYAVGELSVAAVGAFGSAARHFPSQADLVSALHAELTPETTLLIKGSRGSAMDKVVNELFAIDANDGGRHAA